MFIYMRTYGQNHTNTYTYISNINIYIWTIHQTFTFAFFDLTYAENIAITDEINN